MTNLYTLLKNNTEVSDWTAYYAETQKQAVSGLALGEMEKDSKKPNIPKALLLQWIGEVEQIKQQNNLVNKELELLAKLLNEHQIIYAVVKGQVVGSYYERPELRTSGDIDFYCEPEHAARAKDVISKEWGVTMERGDSPYHYHFKHNGITFELHFKLFLFYQKRRKAYWNELVHNAIGHQVKIGNSQVCTLEPTVHALYVFLHLYNHLTKVGVGLRQFCDLSMLLQLDIDRERLKAHLNVLGMEKAFRACEFILKEYIGLDDSCLLYEINANDKKYGQRMMAVVLYRGNMGHYNKRNGWSGLGHQIESAGIKLSHFWKFFWLSPAYHLGWMKRRITLFA